MTDGVIRPPRISVICGQQAARAHIFGHNFELPLEYQYFHFPITPQFRETPQALERIRERYIRVVVVAIRIDRLLDQVSGLLKAPGSKVGPSEHVVDALAVGLKRDGPV